MSVWVSVIASQFSVALVGLWSWDQLHQPHPDSHPLNMVWAAVLASNIRKHILLLTQKSRVTVFFQTCKRNNNSAENLPFFLKTFTRPHPGGCCLNQVRFYFFFFFKLAKLFSDYIFWARVCGKVTSCISSRNYFPIAAGLPAFPFLSKSTRDVTDQVLNRGC